MMGNIYILLCVLAAYAVALGAGSRQKSLLPWMIAGVTIRVVMLMLDVLDVWAPPNSSADAVRFVREAHALSLASWPEIIGALDHRSAVSYVVSGAALFKVIGFHPFAMQATNLVVGTINICLATLLVRRWFGPTAATVAAIFICLYPFAAFNSVVALREEFAVFFFIVGLVLLMRWVDRRSILPFLMANTLFVLASFVHPGFIGAVIASTGYFLFVAVQEFKQSSDRKSAVITMLVGGAMFITALSVLGTGIELGKDIELTLDPTALADTLDGRFLRESQGGSAYPAFIAQGDPFSQPWLVPARMIYFLYSPFPWDVRSPVHISGLVAGLFYLWLSVRAWRAWREGLISGRAKVLGWIFIVLTVIFALGTTNSGTAVRHKTKFFPLLVILAAPTFRRRVVLRGGARLESAASDGRGRRGYW